VSERPKVCPMCNSDDPEFRNRVYFHAKNVVRPCPDPWHSVPKAAEPSAAEFWPKWVSEYCMSERDEAIRVNAIAFAEAYAVELREKLATAERELQMIDETLARRPALDDLKTRYEKVFRACTVAGRNAELEAESLKLRSRIAGLLQENDDYREGIAKVEARNERLTEVIERTMGISREKLAELEKQK